MGFLMRSIEKEKHMAKKHINELQKGDVFYSTFINNDGKVITPKHPFVVIQTGKEIQVIEADAILGAFSLTDINSSHGEKLKKTLMEAHKNIATIIHKKESIVDISTYYLFNEELNNGFKLDKLTVNTLLRIEEAKVDELFEAYIELSIEGQVYINKENLKVLPVDDDPVEAITPSK